MNELESIKKQIVRQATGWTATDVKPTSLTGESWIGKVNIFKEGEEIPKDRDGDLMIPLFQLCLNKVENVPELLIDTSVLTVFVAEDLPMEIAENGDNWVLREYKKSDHFIVKELENPQSFIKAFPLIAQIIEEDYPVGYGGGLTREMEDKISALEQAGIIDFHYDLTKNKKGHKLGGYPSLIEAGTDFGEDFEFVFQIDIDEKAHFNIIDNGIIFFTKNAKTGEWRFYVDFS